MKVPGSSSHRKNGKVVRMPATSYSGERPAQTRDGLLAAFRAQAISFETSES